MSCGDEGGQGAHNVEGGQLDDRRREVLVNRHTALTDTPANSAPSRPYAPRVMWDGACSLAYALIPASTSSAVARGLRLTRPG